VTELAALLQLHDLDLLLESVRRPGVRDRLAGLGFETDGVAAVQRARARLLAAVERRWVTHYERAQRRYGRGVAAVRERVCQGCFITLPTSAQPAPGMPMLCESCGRVLFWPQPAA
jgi:hypothetical protein